MRTYPIPMVPGPVKVPPEALAVYQMNFASADLEPEFLDLYNRTESNLQQLMGTTHPVVIETGEGMLALWAALKNCLRPGDRVLAVSTGLFGSGIGEMARSIGAEVQTVAFPLNQTLNDWQRIEHAIESFRPKMITAVHCETPSGTLNPLAGLGRLKEKYAVPLFYVDAVASIGGAPVLTDAWNIDLCLGGSQKALSAPPSMCFLSVSPRAWEIIDAVGYSGYDALKPFATAQRDFYFPYTPYWHGVAALNVCAELLLAEGLERCFQRHEQAASYCRARLVEMGLELFYAAGAVPSPTVTAVNVPPGISWEELDRRFRAGGLVVGGNYGELAGKVFRLGHMGVQADMALAQQALDVIETVVKGL